MKTPLFVISAPDSNVNTISVDQVAAAQFSRETRYTSLHMDGRDLLDHGHGSGSIEGPRRLLMNTSSS